MSFDEKYSQIKSIVDPDLGILESKIIQIFDEPTNLDSYLKELLTAPSKRLRPLLGFLFYNMAFAEVNTDLYEVLAAVELIHNATLIHDDVIDSSESRRGKQTINTKFSDKLAVIAGDFLLAVALEKIIKINSIKVLEIFTSALKKTCVGELNQFFEKFKIPDIDDYIDKSKRKTAYLFEVGLIAGLQVYDNTFCIVKEEIVSDFALNFGIAFQIRDDIINFLNSPNIIKNDIESGIYTAPLIFAANENIHLFDEPNLFVAVQNTSGVEKSKRLMDNYFDKALFAIKDIEENEYKVKIIELIDLLKTSL